MFGLAKIKDPIKAKATIPGHAKAWRVDLDAGRAAGGVKAEDDATLDIWIVEAPWAHPWWHSYALILVHLRPMPDGRPTKFHLDGATHEFWLYALNPDEDRNEMMRTRALRWLTPMNFAAQIIEPSDDVARARVERAVRMICAGKLSPDTDWVRHWMQMFGDNMIKDKERAGETRIILGSDMNHPDAEIVIPPRRGPQDLN